MKDKKFIPFWMEKDKIEIIEAYIECIHNGEVLLERIEKAVELIKDNYLYYEDRLEHSIVKERYKKYIQILLNILNGEEKR